MIRCVQFNLCLRSLIILVIPDAGTLSRFEHEYDLHFLRMKYVSSPIHTYTIGLAASMGSLLLAAGEKGKRHCLPNASIMIHRSFPFLIIYIFVIFLHRTFGWSLGSGF